MDTALLFLTQRLIDFYKDARRDVLEPQSRGKYATQATTLHRRRAELWWQADIEGR